MVFEVSMLRKKILCACVRGQTISVVRRARIPLRIVGYLIYLYKSDNRRLQDYDKHDFK